MTPREQSLLQQLLRRVAELEPKVKDAEAEALVRAAVAEHPTLPYWLAHRVVLLSRALESAEMQIGFLRDQLHEQAGSAVRKSATTRTGGAGGGPRPAG